jgi:hypothetical protein
MAIDRLARLARRGSGLRTGVAGASKSIASRFRLLGSNLPTAAALGLARNSARRIKSMVPSALWTAQVRSIFWARLVRGGAIVIKPARNPSLIRESLRMSRLGWVSGAYTAKGINTALGLYVHLAKYVARRPYAAGITGGTLLFAWMNRDFLSGDDKALFEQDPTMEWAIDTANGDYLNLSEEEYARRVQLFIEFHRTEFPAMASELNTIDDVAELHSMLMASGEVSTAEGVTHGNLIALDLLVQALIVSGLMNPVDDPAPAAIFASAIELLESNLSNSPSPGELGDLSVLAEAYMVFEDALNSGMTEDVVNEVDTMAALIRTPDMGAYETNSAAVARLKAEKDAVRNLILLAGSRERLVAFAAFLLKLNSMEDPERYLGWLKTVEI